MPEHTREEMLKIIERNIQEFGYHVYFVAGEAVPRFAYTIGSMAALGAELILAGAMLYNGDDAKRILASARDHLAARGAGNGLSFHAERLGSFTLREVHPSWRDLLLLGAIDFYRGTDVNALQIVPDDTHVTIDVPNLSTDWSPEAEPLWQWLRVDWTYDVPRKSTATTNIAALRGGPITEVCRWGNDEWEMFAGAGPDVSEEEARVVPLGLLLAADPSLKAALDLEIGRGLWRHDRDHNWNAWGNAEG